VPLGLLGAKKQETAMHKKIEMHGNVEMDGTW
jgi:hypothetical protein